MAKISHAVVVDLDLWRRIVDALEGAMLCDHDDIFDLVKEIRKMEEE